MKHTLIHTFFSFFAILVFSFSSYGQGKDNKEQQGMSKDSSYYKWEKTDSNYIYYKIDLNKFPDDFEKAMFVKLIAQDTIVSSFVYEKSKKVGSVKFNKKNHKEQLDKKFREARRLAEKCNKEFTSEQKERTIYKYNLFY